MSTTLTKIELADLIESHASLLVSALRGEDRPVAAVSKPVQAIISSGSRRMAEVPPVAPGAWVKVGELEDQSYTWPEGTERYDPFELWELRTDEGAIQIGFGNPNIRGEYYGSERGYWVAFEMINGRKGRPILIFMESGDFATTGDLIAVIKGKGDGGRSMFGPGDELPAGYADLDVELFKDRISGPQAYNRMAVVAKQGDRQAICTHAALQLGLR
jgi:hypothetical protein